MPRAKDTPHSSATRVQVESYIDDRRRAESFSQKFEKILADDDRNPQSRAFALKNRPPLPVYR